VILGIYWQGHRAQFQFIRFADHMLHTLNIFLLAFVSLLPFTSNLLGRYIDQPISLVFYGANLVAVGVLLWTHWVYATSTPQLVNDQLSPAVIRYGNARYLFAPCSYLPAIAFAFIHPTVSLVLYASVPILYIVPGIQRYWYRIADCEEVAKKVDA
jgi:uncharacterized membrane protein